MAELQRTGEQALPKRVGRYEAFLQIGAGGMARVYLAVQRAQPGQAQLVVVKILRPEAVEDEHVRSLFMDEARIATRLQHPNVIRTREVIAEPPDYLLAMDFHNGQSLLQVLGRLGRQAVPLDEHIYILCKVLAGLSYAHELKDPNGQPFGVVHRDVSPANVLVAYNGEVKLLDFGIAKATGALVATQDGVVKGKLGYAAPEQCLGKPADPRSDVYAVGVMLWEAIAGRRRVSGETWQSVLQARLEDAEPQLEDVCPDAPETLAAIVRKALARDPDDRYATAREFQRELERYLGQKPGPKVAPPRIAAMLKPHFEQDRAEQHRAVEAFLNTLRNAGSGQRRLPLPGSTGGAAPAARKPVPPVAEEEQTSRIPVDAALLIMTREEAAKAAGAGPTSPPPRASVPTAPPRAPSSAAPASQASIPTAPPPAATTLPPPRASLPTAPPPAATTAPPPRSSVRTAPPPTTTSAPPARTSSPTSSRGAAPLASSSPPRAFPTSNPAALGLVAVSTPLPGPHTLTTGASAAPLKKRSRALPALLVAAAAAGLGAFGVVSLRKAPTAKAAAPKPVVEHASPAATETKDAKVDRVKVRISVDPADAIVKLDGRLLSSNPFVTTLPRDSDLHELTAYAEGCRDAKQVVHLNQDVDVLLALKHLKGFVRSPTSRTAPRTAKPAPTPAAPAAAEPTTTTAAAATASAPPEPPPLEPGMDLKTVSVTPPAVKPPDEENPYGQ